MNLSDAQALESLTYIGEVAGSYLAMYISITFAYLTAAYFVGASLTRFQCNVVTALYVVFALAIGATTAGWSHAWILMKARHATVINDVWHKNALIRTSINLSLSIWRAIGTHSFRTGSRCLPTSFLTVTDVR